MIEFFPYPFIAGLFLLSAAIFFLFRIQRKPVYLTFLTIFLIYLLILISQTLFPMPLFSTESNGKMWLQNITLIFSRINLVPFNYTGYINPFIIREEIILNILLTIPFGFGFPFISQIKVKDVYKLSAIGFLIEGSQLLMSLILGGIYRTVDITDVLLNGAGVWLGYAIFRIFICFFTRFGWKVGFKSNGFISYIFDIALQTQTDQDK